MDTMRAAVYYGPRDLRVEDAPPPTAPGRGELLLDVGLAAICGTDIGEFVRDPSFVPLHEPHPHSGHVGPMILGHEFFGRVAAVGADVHEFAPGQRVVCGAGVSCGACPACTAGLTNVCARYYTIGLHTDGGLAERVRVPARTCVSVPDSCSDIAAVLAQPLSIGVHCADRARVGEGDSVVVIGVGGIGSLIVAAAVSRKASVTAVDIDPERLAVATRLGATSTFGAANGAMTALRGASIVIEATGTAAGFEAALSIVNPGGRVLLVGLQYAPPTVDFVSLTLNEVELLTSQAHVCATDLPEAVQMLSSLPISEHVVDRVVDLERVVEDGFQATVDGEVHGKVVVRVDPQCALSAQ
jgi:(R,R)-butanediol dehydrogenase / meso-butanediol dehydrogenase / diacetyl reductase